MLFLLFCLLCPRKFLLYFSRENCDLTVTDHSAYSSIRFWLFCHKVISSIMAKLEMAKNIHISNVFIQNFLPVLSSEIMDIPKYMTLEFDGRKFPATWYFFSISNFAIIKEIASGLYSKHMQHWFIVGLLPNQNDILRKVLFNLARICNVVLIWCKATIFVFWIFFQTKIVLQEKCKNISEAYITFLSFCINSCAVYLVIGHIQVVYLVKNHFLPRPNTRFNGLGK